MNNAQTAVIRELNDNLRTQLVGGRLVISAGLSAEGHPKVMKVLQAVMLFNAFTPENDPYGEHDMGIVNIDGEDYNWKIDYYDRNYRYHSPDATDPAVTRRVLTICQSLEW